MVSNLENRYRMRQSDILILFMFVLMSCTRSYQKEVMFHGWYEVTNISDYQTNQVWNIIHWVTISEDGDVRFPKIGDDTYLKEGKLGLGPCDLGSVYIKSSDDDVSGCWTILRATTLTVNQRILIKEFTAKNKMYTFNCRLILRL